MRAAKVGPDWARPVQSAGSRTRRGSRCALVLADWNRVGSGSSGWPKSWRATDHKVCSGEPVTEQSCRNFGFRSVQQCLLASVQTGVFVKKFNLLNSLASRFNKAN